MTSKIEIYKSKNGETLVEVTFEKDTVWLSQSQLSELFGRDRTVIGRHIRNIFKEGELEENVVSADFAHTTQHGAIKGKTQTKRAKYKRLQKLQNSFKLLKGVTISSDEIQVAEIKNVIDLLTDYALGLDILDGYDHQNLEIKETEPKTSYKIKYTDAKKAIEQLRTKFGGGKLFGNEKDDSFKSSISTINQTFDGIELYPSIDEKAANLLYFVVKNHSFNDRIRKFLSQKIKLK